MGNDINSILASQTGNAQAPSLAQVYSTTLNLVGAAISYDLKPLVNLNRIKQVQGIFVDNSAGIAPFSVDTSASFPMIVPAGYQGILPLYLSADNVLTFSGNGTVGITLVNFPTPAMVWQAAAPPQSANVVGGLLQVQDTALENLIVQGGLNVNNGGLGTGDTKRIMRIGNAYSGSLTAAGTTAIIGGSPTCFVTGIDVVLSPDSQIAAGGLLTVAGSFTNSGTVFSRRITLAPATNYGDYRFYHAENLCLVGAIGGDTFNLVVTSPGGALSQGAIEYTIIGGTTGTV